METHYQFWSNEQIIQKYKSLSADVQCTSLFLESQQTELKIIEDLLTRRGITLDITNDNK